ncbi:MAG: hypothetical protein ACYTFQ_00260 [Planctomycetota bacterium]
MKECSEIPIGTVFAGTIGSYSGVFLRTFDGSILLKTPSITLRGSRASARVYGYEEVQADLTITDLPKQF